MTEYVSDMFYCMGSRLELELLGSEVYVSNRRDEC